ncbi:hypothetical protein N7493_011641 [Penicillium malachiteum]|uniref:Thioesterase domain-containing protein n=1 Tax=Penicillium malachiteum TaxID=1324776 RepID=A0AAD6MQ72_9EURO|nr:hypothetical protein N7493_011641 [Penicillium malachiteum]
MASKSVLEIESLIDNHPMIQDLRKRGKFVEYRGYEDYPQDLREQNLTAGPLTGPQMIPIAPYVFVNQAEKSLVEILYLGNHVSGYPGIIHGGLLATILDEGLGWCCFPFLPGKAGATVALDLQFINPLSTDSYMVLKAQVTSVVERKAFVEGHIETLPENGDPVLIAKARATFVAPRNMKLG